jgi:hypothetical protein
VEAPRLGPSVLRYCLAFLLAWRLTSHLAPHPTLKPQTSNLTHQPARAVAKTAQHLCFPAYKLCNPEPFVCTWAKSRSLGLQPKKL